MDFSPRPSKYLFSSVDSTLFPSEGAREGSPVFFGSDIPMFPSYVNGNRVEATRREQVGRLAKF